MYFFYSWSARFCSWSFSLYEGPLILITEQWCSKRSSKALVSTGSPKISAHFEKIRFVVMIVLVFSYLFDIRLKKRFAVSGSIFSYPTSSMINSLYLQNHLILVSSLFSEAAFFSCDIKSWNVIKYTQYLCFAASIPIDTARFVLPTPGVPQNMIFSAYSIKRSVKRSMILDLSSDGWKLKSNSQISFKNGKLAPNFDLYCCAFFLKGVIISIFQTAGISKIA